MSSSISNQKYHLATYPFFQVQIKCMQTFRSILGHSAANVSAGFIHALAPKVLQYLHGEQARRVTTDLDLALTLESLGVVEALVRLAEPQHRKYTTHCDSSRCYHSVILYLEYILHDSMLFEDES